MLRARVRVEHGAAHMPRARYAHDYADDAAAAISPAHHAADFRCATQRALLYAASYACY